MPTPSATFAGMLAGTARRGLPLAILIAGLCLVDWHPGAAATKAKEGTARPTQSAPAVPSDTLPDKVQAMRAAILAAARSGDIEELRTALEWNELKPEVGAASSVDPIAHWKAVSADGQGREILAILLQVLESPHAVAGAGTPGERYVWPGVAEAPLDALDPQQEVQLYRLVTPAEVQAMRALKTWTWYRLVIGRDGTWHSFKKAP